MIATVLNVVVVPKGKEYNQLVFHSFTGAKTPPAMIKFGSFNVNGLDVESSWAVQQLLREKGFNVSNINIGYESRC